MHLLLRIVNLGKPGYDHGTLGKEDWYVYNEFLWRGVEMVLLFFCLYCRTNLMMFGHRSNLTGSSTASSKGTFMFRGFNATESFDPLRKSSQSLWSLPLHCKNILVPHTDVSSMCPCVPGAFWLGHIPLHLHILREYSEGSGTFR